MAINRYINTHFWNDSYVVNLDPTEKLIFLYLLTNPQTNIAGIYELNMRKVAFDTGIHIDMVKNIFTRFHKDKKIFFDDESNFVIIKNWMKHQKMNPSIKKGIVLVLDAIPKAVLEKIKDFIDFNSLGIDCASLGTACTQAGTYYNLNLNPNLNLNSNFNFNSNENENKNENKNEMQNSKKLNDEYNLYFTELEKVVADYNSIFGRYNLQITLTEQIFGSETGMNFIKLFDMGYAYHDFQRVHKLAVEQWLTEKMKHCLDARILWRVDNFQNFHEQRDIIIPESKKKGYDPSFIIKEYEKCLPEGQNDIKKAQT